MAPNRNDPCPCGSGKKFKKCCGKSTAQKSSISSLKGRVQAKSEDSSLNRLDVTNLLNQKVDSLKSLIPSTPPPKKETGLDRMKAKAKAEKDSSAKDSS